MQRLHYESSTRFGFTHGPMEKNRIANRISFISLQLVTHLAGIHLGVDSFRFRILGTHIHGHTHTHTYKRHCHYSILVNIINKRHDKFKTNKVNSNKNGVLFSISLLLSVVVNYYIVVYIAVEIYRKKINAVQDARSISVSC